MKNNPDKAKEYSSTYNNSEKGKAVRKEYNKKYSEVRKNRREADKRSKRKPFDFDIILNK